MHWNDSGCTFALALANGWHKLVPAYKTFRQVKEQRCGSDQQCERKEYPYIASPQHQKTANSCFQWCRNRVHLTRSVRRDPVCDITPITPIAPYCKRECWPAGRMAAHVSWWEQLKGHCGAASFGLQNIATESGGLPKHNLINNFGHYCFRSYTLDIKQLLWRFVLSKIK